LRCGPVCADSFIAALQPIAKPGIYGYQLPADILPLILYPAFSEKGVLLMKKTFYDISMTIHSGMISWPSDGPVKVDRIRSMDEGERLNLSRLDMSAHTGTHIDAPVHFIKGESGVDSLPLEILIGPSAVIHIPGVQAIGAAEIENAGIPAGVERVLLKTDNAELAIQREFNEQYSFVTPEGARFLIDSGIRLVGIDYLSIAQYGKGDAVHQALLGAGTVIIEGLDLRGVATGSYIMIALPLKIAGCDGAPARVVLQEL
jgi:arylformamidase